MSRVIRTFVRAERRWPATVEYVIRGEYTSRGRTWIVHGIGRTPRKARLELLFQQNRRRFPPHE